VTEQEATGPNRRIRRRSSVKCKRKLICCDDRVILWNITCLWTSGNTFLQWDWPSTGTGCPV